MSDTVKLIIEIPKDCYEVMQKTKAILGSPRSGKTLMSIIYSAVADGTPLDDVLFALKKEIKEKCDRIDDIARANMYQYAPHREIQDLLCEILTSIGKAESEVGE